MHATLIRALLRQRAHAARAIRDFMLMRAVTLMIRYAMRLIFDIRHMPLPPPLGAARRLRRMSALRALDYFAAMLRCHYLR